MSGPTGTDFRSSLVAAIAYMSEISNQHTECILKYHLLSIVLTVTNVLE